MASGTVGECVYRNQNDEFASEVYRDGGLCRKIVHAKHADAWRMLSREHEFLLAVRGAYCAPYVREWHADPDAMRYEIVMDWIEGHAPDQAPEGDVPRFVQDYVYETTHMADLLRAHGIRHRDIREANVICLDLRAVLIDFGWAVWDWETDYYTPPGLAAPDDDAAFAALREKYGWK